MKTIMMLLVLTVSSWSASYDTFLLDTQLSLLPKIAILEKNIAFSSNKSPFRILIVYDHEDDTTVKSCIKILKQNSNGRINNHPILIEALSFDKIDKIDSYHFIYVLKANESQLKKIHAATISSGAVTAVYDSNKLTESGLLLSIKMERTPVILINSKALRENRFSFPDSLLEISRLL